MGPHYASTPSTARRRHTFGSLPKVWVGGASHSLGSHSFTPPRSAGHPSLETLLPPSHLLPPLVHEPDAHSAQPPSRGFQAAPPPSALCSRPPAGGTPFGSLPKVWVGGVASSSLPFTCSQVISRTSYIGLPPCCRVILMASRLGGNRFGIRLGGFFVVFAGDLSHTAPRRTSVPFHLPQQPLRQPPLRRPQAPLPPLLRPLRFPHQQPQLALSMQRHAEANSPQRGRVRSRPRLPARPLHSHRHTPSPLHQAIGTSLPPLRAPAATALASAAPASAAPASAAPASAAPASAAPKLADSPLQQPPHTAPRVPAPPDPWHQGLAPRAHLRTHPSGDSHRARLSGAPELWASSFAPSGGLAS